MSNEKRFVVKHGLQSQNMEFVSPDKAKRISVSMLDSGTISFTGDSGELFSITDTMSGTIFAVNDISGIPSLEVDDDGIVRIAESVGNVLIGTTVDNGNKLQVSGNASVSGNLIVNGGISATSGDLNLNTLDLNAITTSKAVTAADVFVYDTSKDSDGGAWRKRTQHTSWYNETLNTATRGSRREFPAVAVIVAESNNVTIYDGDDPTLPMWIVFSVANGGLIRVSSSIRSLASLNGAIAWGVSDGAEGLTVCNFIEDVGRRFRTPATAGVGDSVSFYNAGLALRNANFSGGGISLGDAQQIVNAVVNDVAMTVLPNAPIDPATGLPVLTIAVATAGGVSVIKDDKTVVDIINYGQAPTKIKFVDISGTQRILTQSRFSSWSIILNIPTSDITLTAGAYFNRDGASDPLSGTAVDYTSTGEDIVVGKSVGLLRVLSEPGIIGNDITIPDLRCDTKSTYTTGWMPGDIKGAFLSDISATSLVGSGELVTNGDFSAGTTNWLDFGAGTGWNVTDGKAVHTAGTYGTIRKDYTLLPLVTGNSYILTFSLSGRTVSSIYVYGGGVFLTPTPISVNQEYTYIFRAVGTGSALAFEANTAFDGSIDNISVRLAEADRSSNNKGLVVNGTITRTPVATGAGLVAYSGFSTTNYLEQTYNSDFDFGTGDFCAMGWMKGGGSGQVLFDRRNPTNLAQAGFYLYIDTSPAGTLRFSTVSGSGESITNSNRVITDLSWKHFCVVRDVSGTRQSVYINGVLDKTATVGARNVSNTSATLTLGLESEKDQYPFTGSLALLRISATAPTADQIVKIYNDEKFLFQENAACTLYGSSDAVTALAHDPDTDLLHVGTSAGRSVFQGLRRVSNTTNPVGTAISACNGLVVEE